MYLRPHFLFATLICFHVGLSQEEIDFDPINRQLRSIETTPDVLDSLNKVAFSHWSSNPDITEKYGRFTLAQAQKLNYPMGIANSNSILGISMWARDLYDEALKHYLIALPLYEELGSARGMANALLNIGTIYDEQRLFERSKSYFHKAIEVFQTEKDTIGLSRVYNNMGSSTERNNEHDSSLYYYGLSLELRHLLKDSIGIARVLNNIGDVHYHQGDNRSALENFRKAILINSGFGDLNLQSTLYENIGRNLRILGETKEAEEYLDSALNLAIEIDAKKTQILALPQLSKIEADRGDHEKALEYLNEYVELNELVFGEESRDRIDRLQLQYQTLFNEKRISDLQASETEARLFRNIVIIILLSGLIISLLIFNRQRLSIRKKRIEAENATLREKELKVELEQKQRELASYAVNFVQKGQLLEELKGKIREIKDSSAEGSGAKELNQLIRVIDSSSLIDKEWENFKIRFEEVHHDFFQNLKHEFPDLTAADLKICALLKLNMNMKEAAQVLGISPDSVKISRYRLRKKLGLATEDNLNDFILNFGMSLN